MMTELMTASRSKRNLGSDDARWNAVVRRDRSADGEFFYSVRTTGVYCRPSCASRLARRENVRFMPRAEARRERGISSLQTLPARRAGFRARACRGDSQGVPPDRDRGGGAHARRAGPCRGDERFHFLACSRRRLVSRPRLT